MTLDDRKREEMHVDSCWAGCDDLHQCLHCLSKTCAGDCDEAFADDDDSDPWPSDVVTEYGFGDRGLL